MLEWHRNSPDGDRVALAMGCGCQAAQWATNLLCCGASTSLKMRRVCRTQGGELSLSPLFFLTLLLVEWPERAFAQHTAGSTRRGPGAPLRHSKTAERFKRVMAFDVRAGWKTAFCLLLTDVSNFYPCLSHPVAQGLPREMGAGVGEVWELIFGINLKCK